MFYCILPFFINYVQAMLVHPDKNMGSSLASESFKKLQCAYEVKFEVHTAELFL